MNIFSHYFFKRLKGGNDINLKKVNCYSPVNVKDMAAPIPASKGPPRR